VKDLIMHLLELIKAFFVDLAKNGLTGPAGITLLIATIFAFLIIVIFKGRVKNTGDKE
jgi:hypothetical protein